MCVTGQFGDERHRSNLDELRVLLERVCFLDILLKCRGNRAHASIAYRLGLAANRPHMLELDVDDF